MRDTRAWTADERRLRLEAMFAEYAPRILDYARYRGATLAEAEDVVSEVFVVLTRRLEDAPAAVLPWLLGVARKALGNQMRSKRRREALRGRIAEHVKQTSSAVEALAVSETTRGVLIRQGLSMLPPREREALLLVTWDDLSYEEAARALGCTRDAVAQLLARARRRLMALLEEMRTYDGVEQSSGEM